MQGSHGTCTKKITKRNASARVLHRGRVVVTERQGFTVRDLRHSPPVLAGIIG